MRGSNHKRARFGFLIALGLALLSGCASVKIQKIDASGNASGPEGMRFYLPRPYVSVYEPFIVSAKSYLVRGQLSGDGNYVLINDTPPELKDLLTSGSGNAQLLSNRVTSSEAHVHRRCEFHALRRRRIVHHRA